MARRDRKLYKILSELDCELQMLGARGDWGVSTDPSFAAETLCCCLRFISKDERAPQNLLTHAARELLDTSIKRERANTPPHTAAAWATADDANFATFKKLVDSYEKEFRQPESDFDSAVVPQ